MPLWITYHGWIIGLNELHYKGEWDSEAIQQPNWMTTAFFPDTLTRSPRTKLDKATVEEWSKNIVKARTLTLNIMDGMQPDLFQQLKNMDANDMDDKPWANVYDAVDGYNTYCHLYNQYQIVWDQQLRITQSVGLPIKDQLAYPPKAQRTVVMIARNPRAKISYDRDALLSDFIATIQPVPLQKLDTINTFDEPFIGDGQFNSSCLYHEEIDEILDFLVANPKHPDLNSTTLDEELVEEPILDEVTQLLSNLDLQQDEINRIIDNFEKNGIKLRDIITTLFDIKPHDRDLLLNRLLHFNNIHAENIQRLRPADKQMVNKFIIDLVALFDCHKIRKISTESSHWLNNDHSVRAFTALIQNKIQDDVQNAEQLQNGSYITINRNSPSTLVQQLTRVYDLYLLNSSYLIDQRKKTAQFFLKTVQDVANRRVDDSIPTSLLKYIIARHSTKGNLINMIPHKKLKMGATGQMVAEPYIPVWKTGPSKVKTVQVPTMDTTMNTTTGPNDLESTFDRAMDTQQDD